MTKRIGKNEAQVSRARHENHCSVCLHSERDDIEREWVGWGNTSRIGKEYKLTRAALYRHAHAVGLFEKRRRNISKALERIIEQVENVEVNASAVVSAVQAYAKINAQGQWVERVERVALNELFEKMTKEELEAYAQDGTLPTWFSRSGGVTVIQHTATDSEA
jgi:hypothetical protein